LVGASVGNVDERIRGIHVSTNHSNNSFEV